MICNIKNANSKIIGTILINKDKIEINNYSKSKLIIIDKELIHLIQNKSDDAIIKLYDDYTLTTAEIAAIFGEKYYIINNKLKNLPIKTSLKSGRRNSSYSKKFSKERTEKMSKSLKGKAATYYERTSEIRQKISNSLKKGYLEGRIVQDPKLKSKAWADGKYKNASTGSGICGYFTSLKMNKTFHFKSLLELWYMIILEEDETITSYEYEPFSINISEISVYIPDFIVNNKILIELKAKDTIKFRNPARFEKEMNAMKSYCKSNGLIPKLIYDKDLYFSTRFMKKYLKLNPDIVKKYHIILEK